MANPAWVALRVFLLVDDLLIMVSVETNQIPFPMQPKRHRGKCIFAGIPALDICRRSF
jgi:hypothetical protein